MPTAVASQGAESPVASQVAAARRSVLALPRPDLAVLEVSGKDRVTWLNGLVTCDLLKHAPDDAVYGLAVARSGRVLSDVTVVVDDARSSVLVVVPAAVVAALREHLDHYLVMEDVEIGAGGEGFEVWAAHGPRSGEVLEAARAAGGVGGRIDRTGFGGAVVVARASAASAVRAAVEAGVARAGGATGGERAWDALRLERGVPRFGADFDERTYPQEAALEKAAVSFDKGCYLGQEVVCMLEMRGHVKRKLASLVIAGERAPARGAPVTDEAGAAVGEITSAELSPTLGRPVALAMLKRAYTEAGKRLTVDGAGAEVVERPA